MKINYELVENIWWKYIFIKLYKLLLKDFGFLVLYVRIVNGCIERNVCE